MYDAHTVLRLRDEEELSWRMIEEQTGIPKEAARSLYKREKARADKDSVPKAHPENGEATGTGHDKHTANAGPSAEATPGGE